MPTTPPQSAGVRRRQRPHRIADMIGVLSANSGHYATIPGAVRTCGTFCGHTWHCTRQCTTNSRVLLPLQDPRRPWEQPCYAVRTLTSARPPSAAPSAFCPGRTRRIVRSTEDANPPTGATGCRRDLRMAERLPRMTATPDAMLYNARQQQLSTVFPQFGGG